MTALYVSMSAKEKDLEISDDLAKGNVLGFGILLPRIDNGNSAKSPSRSEIEDLLTVQEELCSREGCTVS